MNVCEAYPFFCFLTLLVNKKSVTLKRERVSAAMEIVKKEKSAWRQRIYRKYVSWNRLQKLQDEIYART